MVKEETIFNSLNLYKKVLGSTYCQVCFMQHPYILIEDSFFTTYSPKRETSSKNQTSREFAFCKKCKLGGHIYCLGCDNDYEKQYIKDPTTNDEYEVLVFTCDGCSNECNSIYNTINNKENEQANNQNVAITKTRRSCANTANNSQSKKDSISLAVESIKCCKVCEKSTGILRFNQNNEWIHHICGLFSENYECTSYSNMSFRMVDSKSSIENAKNLKKCNICNSTMKQWVQCLEKINTDMENEDQGQVETVCGKEVHLYCLMKEKAETMLNEGEDEECEKTWTIDFI